jgi:aspartate 1-decarboxylase
MMLRHVCKGKLHRLTVTQADLNYMGSITLDPILMEAADIRPHEMLQITNLQNGTLWHTYALPGAVGSGTVCLNGPPARHFQPGDTIIVLSTAWISDDEWSSLEAKVVFVDEKNNIQSVVKHHPWPPESEVDGSHAQQ